jgi:hypothetical protein
MIGMKKKNAYLLGTKGASSVGHVLLAALLATLTGSTLEVALAYRGKTVNFISENFIGRNRARAVMA